MDPAVAALLDDFQQCAALDAPQREASSKRHAWLSNANDRQVDELIGGLLERDAPTPGDAADYWLSRVLARLGRAEPAAASHTKLPAELATRIVRLYRRLGPTSEGRHHLLRLLAERGDDAALASLADLLVDDPPSRATDAAVAITPLFRRRDYHGSALFPRLLDALAHLSLAAPVLDLANYLTREQLVAEHPAAASHRRLEETLGQIAQRLQRLEERPDERDPSARELQQTVEEGVALVVSLCDALALIGDASSVGKLYQALDLRHRRIRTEAAGALARFREQAGIDALVELAAEPVARLRVLAYAEELGLLERIDPRHQSDVARAEAELALWLAQPSQFGIPPTRLELLDERTQAWPGYDEPVACFLFRFDYELGSVHFANIGIAGPLVLTFRSDLFPLPADDLYALFAGWQAEHDDIYRLPAERLEGADRLAADRLQRFLEEAGYTRVAPAWLGVFFGERSLVVEAAADGQAGAAVVDQDSIFWLPAGNLARPLGVEEAYCIYKGRRLLAAFNL